MGPNFVPYLPKTGLNKKRDRLAIPKTNPYCAGVAPIFTAFKIFIEKKNEFFFDVIQLLGIVFRPFSTFLENYVAIIYGFLGALNR